MRLIRSGLIVSAIAINLTALSQTNDVEQKGIPADGVFHVGDVDVVNVQNGNLHISIPIASVKQRGGSEISWKIVYDTQNWIKRWSPNTSCDSGHCSPAGEYFPDENSPVVSGWRFISSNDWGIDFTETFVNCTTVNIDYDEYTNWSIVDPEGGHHPMALRMEAGLSCKGETLSGPTLDGSGYTYDVNTGIIRAKNGSILGYHLMKDANGNIVNNAGDSLNRSSMTTIDGPTITYTTPLGGSIPGPQYTRYTVLNSNGTSETYEVDYQAIDESSDVCAKTGPGSGYFPNDPYGCTDVDSAPFLVYRQLLLPNGKAYVFTYANNTPGDLARLDLPTGASIAYTYDDLYQPQYSRVYSSTPSISGGRVVASRTQTVNGVTEPPTTYDYHNGASTTVVDTAGNSSIHTFSTVTVGASPLSRASSNRYETQVITKDQSGNVVRAVDKTYTGEVDLDAGVAINVRPSQEIVTLDNGQQMKKETDYETFTYTCLTCDTSAGASVGVATRMNPTEVRFYDYGASAPGALLKKIDFAYLHASSSSHLNANIVDKVTNIAIYDGSGNKVSETLNEFDNYGHTNQPMVASGAIQHDSAYDTSYSTRGNLTATSKWRNTDGGYLTTTNQYDDSGNLISSIDPGGHRTDFDYTDSWGNGSCAPSGQAKAFPTKVTDAKGKFSTTVYNSCTDTIASTTDANGNSSTLSYGLMNRVTHSTAPDGGTKDFCYSDDPAGSCAGTVLYSIENDLLSSSVSRSVRSSYDGLGRLSQTQLTSDPDGTVNVDIHYDSLGRVYSKSNPYRGSETIHNTITQYDSLGRVLSTTQPDGSGTSSAYSGNRVANQDEAGRQRVSYTDALGRLTQVFEDPANLNYETDYAYDALGNLLQVAQKGESAASTDWRVRTFTYNSLGQLLCAANPEIGSPSASPSTCPAVDTGTYIDGAVRYAYDNDGDLVSKISPLPNQSGSLTVTASYSYDVLHRSLTKTFSDGTPSVSYAYDGDTLGGCSVPALSGTNLVGHISAMCDGAGATAWSYDPMGRVVVEQRRNGALTDQSSYTYYYDGSQHTVTYPASGGAAFTMTYGINSAGRLYEAVGSDSVVYGHVTNTHATGAPYHQEVGPGVSLEETYNARLQPQTMTSTQVSPSSTIFSRTYDFHAGYGDNGNVWSVTDGMDALVSDRPSGTLTYTYDMLNRVTGAQTIGTDCTPVSGGTRDWGESFTVDAWGNLVARSSTKCMSADVLSTSADARNRLTSGGYDSAGNITLNNGNGYVYNAEGELSQAGGTAYTYDGLGVRVTKPGKIYWGSLVETDDSGANPVKYVFFGGRRIARLDPGAADAKYYIADNVGSTSVVTDASGNVLNESLFYPYGGEMTVSALDTGNNFKFTGKERDPESGLDNFGARFYASQMGRFMTPDWADKPTAVPYASYGDPQTLNLFSYVENAPLNRVDADGHVGVSPSAVPGNLYGTDPSCDNPLVCGPEAVQRSHFGTSYATTGDLLNLEAKREAVNQVSTKDKIQAQQQNSTTPVQTGVQWLTGTGPRNQTFHDGDPFTEQLRHHDNVQEVINGVRDGSLPPNGDHDYKLDGAKGVGLYLRDYSTLLTGGATGNLAVTYLGSYSLHYTTSDGVITMTVKNSSTLGSATHLPIFGYTSAGQSFSRFMTGLSRIGPMSPTTQTFIFHENVVP